MGRKAKALGEGSVDLLSAKTKADEEKNLAPEDKAEEKKKKSYGQRMTEFARAEGHKIISEHTAKIHPLCIEYLGKRTPVADPNGVWAMRTPPFFKSPKDHILFALANKPPRIMAVLDLETFGLRAGVLHHAITLKFEDDDQYFTRDDFPKVKFHHSWSDVGDFIAEMMVDLIIKCQENPDGGKEGKIYAHNGSRFDFVGLALHLGMDRNTGYYREVRVPMPDGSSKVFKLNYRIVTHSGKSSLVVYAGRGRGGEYRLKLVDSYHILSVPLHKLGDSLAKGVTPDQFTNPIAWINRRLSAKYAKEGKWENLTLVDFRKYLYRAHKRPLVDFKSQLSGMAYEGLELWRSTIEDPDYSCSDVIVLANALKRFARKFRDFSKGLADLLGQDVVDSLQPFAFNTASTAGFALSAAYWYESRLERDADGNVVMKRSLSFSQKKDVYALVDGGTGYARILNKDELREELDSGTLVQNHGVVPKGERVIVEYPVWTSAFDNRFARMAQNGSQTTVFKPLAHKMIEVDANSAFPAAMANGCRKPIRFVEMVEDGGVRHVGGSRSPITSNALVGFEDPGYRSAMPTAPMVKQGIATVEEMLNEQCEKIRMWVVRGRQKILHMLQLRNGEFTCILPPSTEPALGELPGIPLRTPGRGLDSRLINPRIVHPTMALLRGEYLAAYAAYPTLDDNAMVVYLCEVTRSESGRDLVRDRSRHGPIMGVAMDATGKVFGQPHMPHRKFHDMLFNTRLGEKKQAADARARGDERLAEQCDADAMMTKLIMNGGGYGTYAQSKRPETDFNLGSLDECVEIIENLTGLDPAWNGMLECVKRLAPDYKFNEELCGWGDLYAAIDRFRIDWETALQKPDDYHFRNQQQILVVAMKNLFTEWADNHITSFTTHMYRSQEIGPDGQRVMQLRGIITAAEETASHAIRCYASAIVAKSAVNLHEGQLAAYRSPFGLAYSDTDSLHFETGVIKPFTDEKIIDIVRREYSKWRGHEPVDHRQALEEMMNSGIGEVDKIGVFVQIMKVCGLEIGKGLGQWGIEEHRYSKGLVHPVLEGEVYHSHRTFYLSPKIYIDTDSIDVVARTKVRSVPKLNPIQPAVFEGHIVGVPSLADRRGLDQETFRNVKLDAPRRMTFGKKIIHVESMFSSPRRIYQDTATSTPFNLEMPPEMEAKILAGQMFSPDEMSRRLMKTIGLDEEQENIKGLRDAYLIYRATARIKGKSFDDTVDIVEKETAHIKSMIDTQVISEDFDPEEDASVIAMPEENSYSEYVKRLEEEYDAKVKKDGYSSELFVPF